MKRITSIDIFRAITMLLMIFVNDLWTLHGVPHWLEHTSAREDALGLSDIVFPAFLFIVGLSIPFAIKSRISKGDTKPKILLHILKRTLSLVIMGFFMVNLEFSRQNNALFTQNTNLVIMVTAFFLIWNHYEKKKIFLIIPVWILQACGILMLCILAITYKGGTAAHPQWMSPHWWGILGLIGWAYLLSSIAYLFTGNKIWVIGLFLIFLHALNAQEFYPVLKNHSLRFIISASNHALVMSGIFATLIFLELKNSEKKFLYPLILIIPAMISMVYGFVERPLWGISKILATPSWTAICAGISFICFAVIYVIADIFKHTWWSKLIMPAGRNALVCYLLSTVIYALFYRQIMQIPGYLTSSLAGIAKSFIFALAIVMLTGGLEKLKIKIKL